MSCDRQTDKSQLRSTWWSVTCFDEAEKKMLLGNQYAPFVLNVYGGLEECPATHKEHYQGAVQCRGQQRFSAIKKWLPRAHIEPARQVEALKKYVMKAETAVGEKTVTANTQAYVDNQTALLMIAEEKVYGSDPLPPLLESAMVKDCDAKQRREQEYWFYSNRLVYEQPQLIGVFCKPDILRGWIHFEETLCRLARERKTAGADSITAPGLNEIVEPGEDLKEEE